MPCIDLGSLGPHTKLDVSGTPVTFTANRPYVTYLLFSERAIQISRDAEPDEDSFVLPASTFATVSLDKDDTLSFVVASGETDGTLSILEQ